MSQPYSHRNGETEPPDHMEYGPSYSVNYFFQGYIDGYGNFQDLTTVDQVNWEMSDYCGVSYKLNKAHGRWWGPVMPPWEHDA